MKIYLLNWDNFSQCIAEAFLHYQRSMRNGGRDWQEEVITSVAKGGKVRKAKNSIISSIDKKEKQKKKKKNTLRIPSYRLNDSE